jgi:general secretion pathway protein G
MPSSYPSRATSRKLGFTLLELIVAATILSILTLMALPLARVTIQREKEKQLRRALWEMRDAIDRYKDMGERGAFQIKADSFGYPPDLDTLVKGVEGQAGKKTRFLRSVPIDPMTKNKEWGLRSMQDDPDSDSWGGQNGFDGGWRTLSGSAQLGGPPFLLLTCRVAHPLRFLQRVGMRCSLPHRVCS